MEGAAYFRARLSGWEELRVNPEDILWIIRNTYSIDTPLTIADSAGGVSISLVVVDVTTTLTLTGSGEGEGSSDYTPDVTTTDITTSNVTTISKPVVVTADAEKLKPHLLLVSILTAVAVATGGLRNLG